MSSLRFPAVVPTLLGKTFCLRELGEEDIPSWFERATDAESADLAGDPIPTSAELGASWLQKHREQFRRKRGLRWAIVPAGSAQSVGTVGLAIGAGSPPFAELGIVVARSWWGRGLGTAAARKVADFALGEIGLHELRAEVLQRNRASVRLLEKTGFRLVRELPPTHEEPEVLLSYALARGNHGAA